MASSSNAQVPAASVPALPFALIEGGPNGETIEIPSDTTVHTRSRSTPEHALRDLPPGLTGGLHPQNVRRQQNMFSVRQEIAAIEQRLLMLQNMEQQFTVNQQAHVQQQQHQHNLAQQSQQNNFV